MDRTREDTQEHNFEEALDATRAARFFVEEPGRAPRVVYVSPDHPLRIGRGADQDVYLADLSVSRAHAELTFEASGVVVRDLGSANGTWLGTTRITGTARVPPGIALRVGNARLVPVPPESAAFSGEMPPSVPPPLRDDAQPRRPTLRLAAHAA